MKKFSISLVCFYLLTLTSCEDTSCPILPTPLMNYSTSWISEGSTITFTTVNNEKADDFLWEFEGGTPSFSRVKSPTVYYAKPGAFKATLTYYNECGIEQLSERLVTVVQDTQDSTEDIQYTRTEAFYGNDSLNGKSSFHYMRLYEPSNTSSDPHPVILLFGGGGLKTSSNLGQLEEIALELLAEGYKVATCNTYYFWYKDPPNQQQASRRLTLATHSVKSAVRYFKRFADSLNIDSTKIVVSGFSSGATAALMSSYLGRDIIEPNLTWLGLEAEGFEGTQGNPGYSSIPAACFSLAGQIPTLAGGSLSFLTAEKPPLFGVCGTNDQNVACTVRNYEIFTHYGANALVDSARTRGLCADKYIFEGGDHQSVINDYEEYILRLVAFLERVFENQCD